MEHKDIDRLRQKLEFQRHEARQFLRQLEQEKPSLDVDGTQDSADRCVISMTKESLFERSSQPRTVLRLIEAALKTISRGSFGVCIACGGRFRKSEVGGLTWTQFCLRCQGELEEEISSSVTTRTSTPLTETWKRAG
jgi:RNA polymerase-binding transcription factor DksA